MSIIVVNLQDNRAVFRIFIALLRFHLTLPRTKLMDFAETLMRIFLPAVICHHIDVYRDK